MPFLPISSLSVFIGVHLWLFLRRSKDFGDVLQQQRQEKIDDENRGHRQDDGARRGASDARRAAARVFKP